jgi:hypothetical protein
MYVLEGMIYFLCYVRQYIYLDQWSTQPPTVAAMGVLGGRRRWLWLVLLAPVRESPIVFNLFMGCLLLFVACASLPEIFDLDFIIASHAVILFAFLTHCVVLLSPAASRQWPN